MVWRSWQSTDTILSCADHIYIGLEFGLHWWPRTVRCQAICRHREGQVRVSKTLIIDIFHRQLMTFNTFSLIGIIILVVFVVRPSFSFMMTSSNGNIFSALLILCAGNQPVTGEFISQRPVTRSFDVFFGLRLNKRSSKPSNRQWLRRHDAHYDVTVMIMIITIWYSLLSVKCC